MGPFRVCRAVLPMMRGQRSGLIIHVTSIVGRLLFPGCALYCASKFAHEALAEVLHYELTETGLESVIVEPGPYPSQLLPNSPGPADAKTQRTVWGFIRDSRQFRRAFLQLFAPLCTLRPQLRNAKQVVGGTSEHKQPLDLCQSSQLDLLQTANLLRLVTQLRKVIKFC